jgi:predicted ATPase
MGQARELVARTVSAARAMGHAHTLGHALAHGAIFAAVARETQEALSLSEETMAFADEHDMDLWRGYGAILHGHALVLAGRASQAIVPMERGFALLERTQTGTMVPAHHAIHAFALASLGRFDEASREVAIVQGELQSGSERYFWPHCLRWLGDSCRLAPGDGPSEAQPLYARGLALAREQGARSWELVVATGLARLLAEDGDGRRAAGLLEPLLADFAAERDCAPVHEARALLD